MNEQIIIVGETIAHIATSLGSIKGYSDWVCDHDNASQIDTEATLHQDIAIIAYKVEEQVKNFDDIGWDGEFLDICDLIVDSIFTSGVNNINTEEIVEKAMTEFKKMRGQ